MNNQTLYRSGDVAKVLGVSTAAIAKWSKTGRLVPDYITGGGHRLFDKERIDTIKALYVRINQLEREGACQ